MNTLRVHSQTITLVDQVEDRLLNYLKEKDIRTGDSIPNELELAAALGVARSVLREALSRLKMMGMIETRTRRGMILTEPTILGGMKRVVDPRILGEEALFDILGFRIALEIGICSDIFRNITPEDISELEEIVKMGIVFENNEYAPVSEFTFHAKLYEITGRRRTTSLVGCRIKYFRDKSECHHIHVHPCKSLFFRLELHACKRRHLNGCSTHIISVYSILSQIECYNCIRIFRTAIQLFNSNTLQFSFYLISGWSHGDCLILTSYSLKCCYRL